ncbi:helix-turn-helix domain-containing protein [Paenibacillus sp. strain BS8-2]
MKDSFYLALNPQNKSYLWSHRTLTEQPFDGYYHWHWGFEMLYVHQGNGQVIVNQKSYELQAGMLFYFLPNQLHRLNFDIRHGQPYERSVFHFEPAVMDSFLGAFPLMKDRLLRMRKGLFEQRLDLLKYRDEVEAAVDGFQDSRNAGNGGSDEHAALFLLQLLSVIQRVTPVEDKGQLQPIRHADRIMAWVEQHYDEPFELDKLAAEMHLNGSYVSRLFRQETGSSITGYLAARRIQQACSLLRSSQMSVEQVGERVGLPNVSYFIQLFKRMMGTSPHQYRLKL